jgi:outer membrane protein assembly factor BamD
MGNYRAAVVSAKNTLKMYSDVKQKEELEYLIVKSQYLYAMNSIEKKRAERLKEVIDFANDYVYSNGSSAVHSKEIAELSEKAKTEIKKITSLI